MVLFDSEEEVDDAHHAGSEEESIGLQISDL
jgi:hypothetical protein